VTAEWQTDMVDSDKASTKWDEIRVDEDVRRTLEIADEVVNAVWEHILRGVQVTSLGRRADIRDKGEIA